MRIVPVVEDGDFSQFVEEEEVIYVNDGFKMSRDQYGYFFENEEYEYIMVEPTMANPKKDLSKMIDAIESCPATMKSILTWGKRFINPFISKCIFISYFDLSLIIQMITLSIAENHSQRNQVIPPL